MGVEGLCLSEGLLVVFPLDEEGEDFVLILVSEVGLRVGCLGPEFGDISLECLHLIITGHWAQVGQKWGVLSVKSCRVTRYFMKPQTG